MKTITPEEATIALVDIQNRLIVYAAIMGRIVEGYWGDNPVYCEHCAQNVGGKTTKGDHASDCPVKLAQLACIANSDKIASMLVELFPKT